MDLNINLHLTLIADDWLETMIKVKMKEKGPGRQSLVLNFIIVHMYVGNGEQFP